MRRRAMPILVVLGSGWLGALVFGGALRDALIVPLLYLYWYVRLFVEALPQWLLWTLFVILAVALTSRTWYRTIKSQAEPHGRRSEIEMGEVAGLAERVRLSTRGGYFHRRLRQRLRELVSSVLATRQRRSPERVQAELRRHPDELPDAIRPLFTDEPPRPRLSFRLLRSSDIDTLAQAIDWLDRETDPTNGHERGKADHHGD
ncbi:MAG: hypothetical protein ABEK03_10365 [Candidatus Bipolaricaulia bacterium]